MKTDPAEARVLVSYSGAGHFVNGRLLFFLCSKCSDATAAYGAHSLASTEI
jgi:hypothetical protein